MSSTRSTPVVNSQFIVEKFTVARFKCMQKSCSNFIAPIQCQIILSVNNVPVDYWKRGKLRTDIMDSGVFYDSFSLIYEMSDGKDWYEFMRVGSTHILTKARNNKRIALKALVSLIKERRFFLDSQQRDTFSELGLCLEHKKLLALSS